MFITPAMASEPYWAAAPSRNTSIRSIAAAGIAFRSTPTVPRPNVPLTCTNALEWRRLPLTRTSTWSGPRPRRLAGLMWSEPSAMVWCDALNDGASVARIWFTSVWPVSCTSWEVMTSTGTGVSTAVREVRAPTTTISLRARGVAVSLKSTVTVCPAGTTTRCSAASCPMSRARTLCAPAGTLRRYCPFSLVRTLRAVPTTTTLAPTSGAPDSVAATVPETVPVCCATSGTKGTTNRNAIRSGSTGVNLTGHLLEDDGLLIQVWPSNTVGPAGALPRLPRPRGGSRDPAPDLPRQHSGVEPVLELVDSRRLHTDLLEPGLRQQPPILGFLQGAGDAPNPQLHAAPHGRRHVPSNHNIRHGEPAAWFENAEGLAQHLALVGREVDHAVRDDHVHRRIRERDVLDFPLQELDVRDSRLPLVLARQAEHLLGHVEAVGFSGPAHALGGQQDIDPTSGPQVEYHVPLVELGESRGIAAAERRQHRPLRERRRLRGIVEVRADGIAAAAAGPPTAPALAAGYAERGLSVLLLHRLLDLVATHVCTAPYQQILMG